MKARTTIKRLWNFHALTPPFQQQWQQWQVFKRYEMATISERFEVTWKRPAMTSGRAQDRAKPGQEPSLIFGHRKNQEKIKKKSRMKNQEKNQEKIKKKIKKKSRIPNLPHSLISTRSAKKSRIENRARELHLTSRCVVDVLHFV